jgi:hypothetical protein
MALPLHHAAAADDPFSINQYLGELHFHNTSGIDYSIRNKNLVKIFEHNLL